MALTLTGDERTELERRRRSRRIRAEDARRAEVILMLADGASFTTIAATVGCFPDYINRWKQRFETGGGGRISRYFLVGIVGDHCRRHGLLFHTIYFY